MNTMSELLPMRMLVLATALLLFAGPTLAELRDLEPTQNPNAAYRLFRTHNIHTFLKLDTRTGQIWQVQWGDLGARFVVTINEKVLVANAKAGRFTLNPSQNIYTFILLDQERGATWQVQWGNEDHRFIVPLE